MPRVLNKRIDKIPPNAIYVGRPSKWGNPYRATAKVGRLEVITRFREYATQRLQDEPYWLDSLRGHDLVCWCAPLPCHADVLLELANEVLPAPEAPQG